MNRRHPRGFTLVELLIASLLSGVVLASVYFVFIANSRQYYTQEQVVQMQESMRFALEFMKNDLRNAGQLALVNGTAVATDPFYCGPRSAELRAMDLLDDNQGASPLALRSNGNDLQPDQITLMADATGGVLLAARTDGSANVIVGPAAEQISAQAMRAVSDVTRLANTYRAGMYLRVMEPTGRFDLVPINTAPAAGGAIVIGLTRAPLGTCITNREALRINAVQLVRYRVELDQTAGAPPAKTDLIREYLDARAPANRLGNPLTVAEYVVNLQVWGVYDHRAASTPKEPVMDPDANPADDQGNWPNAPDEQTALNTNPHRLRAVNVLLATRSSREDAELMVAPDRTVPPAQRIPADRTWFDVVTEPNGVTPVYARVSTLAARVETPNMMTEGDL